MGCFQSKSHKNKAKPFKMPRNFMGENNVRWRRLLEHSAVSRLIIDDINGVAQHPAYRAIDKDVQRTFPQEELFQKQSNIQLFRQILKCFALTFPKVGYTQGLNFLAGYFLLNKMNKTQSLNVLTSVMTHSSLMFLGLYEDNFPLAHLYCEIFWKVLKKIDTQLYDCLKLIGVPDHMWIFQWYLTFFLYSFPIQYISFFFNSIFQQKRFEIVKISLGIVLCMRKDILQMPQKDDLSFIEYLENLKDLETCMKIVNVEDIIQMTQSINNFSVEESLKQIKSEKTIDNFYLKYFECKGNQRKSMYNEFIQDIEEKKVQLSNSKHDNRLMQSYKRNRHTVEILDEIMLESIKRQMNKKYKSNMMESRRNRGNKNLSFRKWKSLASLEEESQQNQKEGQTTVSIVKKVIIPQDKDQ